MHTTTDTISGTAFWPRAIILVDMNAFFASVEQFDKPAWRGRPVAITNGKQGTCIITCSYEARAYGIKTGIRLKEAYRLCPQLIQRPTRPSIYAQVSTRIMKAISDVCPDIEIFSVDEAFIDMTPCQQLYGSPVHIGQILKRAVFDASGLLCSIGISGDKTTDRKSTRLNSSHRCISYAVFCLKQKIKTNLLNNWF